MANIRFKGGQQSERLGINEVLNNDMIQTRHAVGGADDSDKGIPFGLFQAMPVFNCTTASGTIAKTGVLVSGVTNPDFTLYNGRIISVHFQNKNDAGSPTFNVGGTAYPMRLPNQAASVTIGAGCWGDDVWLNLQFVSDGTNSYWLILGHNIAQQNTSSTSGYTIYADGTSVYSREHFDVNKVFQPFIVSNNQGKATLGTGVWLGISSTAGIGNDIGLYLALGQAGNIVKSRIVAGPGSITASGATVTVTASGVGLPVYWTQVNNKYWF